MRGATAAVRQLRHRRTMPCAAATHPRSRPPGAQGAGVCAQLPQRIVAMREARRIASAEAARVPLAVQHNVRLMLRAAHLSSPASGRGRVGLDGARVGDTARFATYLTATAYCMRTVARRGLLVFRSVPKHGPNNSNSDVCPCGDSRQRLTTALHACHGRAGVGTMRAHSLGSFGVELLAQLSQALLLPDLDRSDPADRDQKFGGVVDVRLISRSARFVGAPGRCHSASPGFQLGGSCCCHDRDTKTGRAGRATTTATFATHQFFVSALTAPPHLPRQPCNPSPHPPPHRPPTHPSQALSTTQRKPTHLLHTGHGLVTAVGNVGSGGGFFRAPIRTFRRMRAKGCMRQ